MKQTKNVIIIFLSLFFLMSCDNQSKQDKTGNNNSTIPNEAITHKEPIHEEAPIVEQISEKEALDFVETWKNIFATHTFDNYIKQYDPYEFRGIKRTYTGEKNTYDYSGWIRNKKNEFRKYSPEVYVENVRVKWLNKNGRTKVSFLQIWVSTLNGNYADKGEKELILKKVNGEIVIVSEELLYSQRYDEYFYGD
jgi:hypothetical protein